MTRLTESAGRAGSIISGSLLSSPFAIIAAGEGWAGLIIGALTVLLVVGLTGDSLWWLLLLLRFDRQQRWAMRKAGSPTMALKLDAASRHTVEQAMRARARRVDPAPTCGCACRHTETPPR
jgi:hypothetical protein